MATPDKETQADALKRLLTALLLASDGPLPAQRVAELINHAVDEEEWPHSETTKSIEKALDALRLTYDGSTGIELVEVGGGWRFRTAADLGLMVGRLWPERRVRLSKAALEALAVVAYRQPCTRPDIEAVRGVDCGGVVRSLLDRGLLKIVGRKEEPGRPLLYGTTPLFLETFSLDDLGTLPSLRDLDNMDREEELRAIRDLDPSLAEEIEHARLAELAAAESTESQGASEDESTEPKSESSAPDDESFLDAAVTDGQPVEEDVDERADTSANEPEDS